MMDLKVAVRQLRKSPQFTVVAVLTLALGIGANTTIFTLVDGLVLTPLPVANPDGLVLVGQGRNCCVNTGIQRNVDLFPYGLYRNLLAEKNSGFAGLAAFVPTANAIRVRPTGQGGSAQPASGKLVSANYFSVMGADPVLGHGFAAAEEDGVEGGHPVVVISDRYWRSRLGADPAVIGRTLEVNDSVFTIVGVAPPGFFGETVGSDPADMWFPLTMQSQIMARKSLLDSNQTYWLYLLGRLAPGVDPKRVEAELTLKTQRWMGFATGSQLSADDRMSIGRARVPLTPGRAGFSFLRRSYLDSLKTLMVMVALVLLIACSNVANLLLARSDARAKEMATRMALGAPRHRLVRQLLTESTLLGLCGGAVGLLFAFWGTRALLALVFRSARYIPLRATPDLRVLGFTLLISLGTGLLFGLAPALKSSRQDLFDLLRSSGSTASTGRGGFGVGKLLVVAQVAVCLTLLVGAALFTSSFVRLQTQDFGFQLASVLDVNIDPQVGHYRAEQLPGLYQRILERVQAEPGVKSASLAMYAPFGNSNWQASVAVPGYTRGANTPGPFARWTRVAPGFFETIGMPVVVGRSIGAQDGATAPEVAVINETMMKRYFGGQNPVGRHFGFEDSKRPDEYEIVGVVKDAKFNSAKEDMLATFYLPLAQAQGNADEGVVQPISGYAHDLLVRTAGDPELLAPRIRAAVAAADPNLPIGRILTMREQVDRSLVQDRAVARLSASFALLALVLVCIGLYGVLTYMVARRTREIGIRIALGARPSHVIGMVMRENMQMILAGIAVGLPLAFAAGGLAASQFFGVQPHDPLTLAAATLVIACVAAAAGYVPARRAAHVDPLVSLRAE